MNNQVNVQFVTSDGQVFDAKADIGTSLMEAAVFNNVPGIEAECGGACVCATCHIYVPEAIEAATDIMEKEMLEETADERKTNSRLSCQLRLTAEMAGMTFTLPERQI